MDESKLNVLKQFVEQCKSDPSILSDPSLYFFCDYLQSLGAELPHSAYKHKSFVMEESDEDVPDTDVGKGNADDEEEDSEEDETSGESTDIELETVVPDNDPPQKMGDPSVKVTEESRDAAQTAKGKAMEAISEGNLEEAIENLTEAILLNPTSATMYATRASVYVKMKKPKAAIRDATAALNIIRPDSAEGYKTRGMAQALLGEWDDAANDLHQASGLRYDEEIGAVLKKVERERSRLCDEAAAAYEKAMEKYFREQAQSSSSKKPEGMPGFSGGMPGGLPGNVDFSKILSDPELMAAFSDPEVMASLQDVMNNPANLAKHKANPKVALVIAKLLGKFGGTQ